ncbi:hypothetical protein [Halocatena pleomorpha]|uniref:Uncharacterized protein n=1 Tax=Halocatena pleomorpha TaxID=1785090 RepID=A0A3P3R666_9EURY|nr:hypothetical protein [Halocatena pleomorpha]RRJ28875.1 hypothetical protein EIK79_14255 [Halocatena pleomorpha]
MPIRRISLRGFLFGRSWDRSRRILLTGIVVSIVLGVIGTVVPLGVLVFVRSDIAGWVAILVLLGTAGGLAYTNAGYVVVVVIQLLLLVGLFTSGGVATFPGTDTVEYLQLLIWFSVVFALVSGSIGYMIGWLLRTVR